VKKTHDKDWRTKS